MCGRFVGYSSLEQIQAHFKVETVEADSIQPSYNIAPQQELAVITQEGSKRILSLWSFTHFKAW